MALTIVGHYVMQTRTRFPKSARACRWQKHESWPVYAEHCETRGTENATMKARAEEYAESYALRNAAIEVRVVHT